ncbi:hypothetical protein LV457_00835 [Mycobacterium sp. MYCO198283]|uniref:hypothetical protein n=1 Tax=Mycobacterium sp. MYCO198283 TaxID=2883505 RepID=UPI001E370C71|nr:hypothetical protein [Mycobacterium sp. MYCO198283]MCG5430845.1 hypothetical protein [Mycobacterium sp. MYCO198283]
MDAHEEWGSRDVELLHHAVLDEMQAMNSFHQLGVSTDALELLAWAVTTRVDYAFAVRWSPDWVPPGRPHTWRDDEGWHARCNDCLSECAAAPSETEAVAWFDAHAAGTHPGGRAPTQ